jgi:hypothetical protein
VRPPVHPGPASVGCRTGLWERSVLMKSPSIAAEISSSRFERIVIPTSAAWKGTLQQSRRRQRNATHSTRPDCEARPRRSRHAQKQTRGGLDPDTVSPAIVVIRSPFSDDFLTYPGRTKISTVALASFSPTLRSRTMSRVVQVRLPLVSSQSPMTASTRTASPKDGHLDTRPVASTVCC